MKPTQAQIEAALDAIAPSYLGAADMKAALTAAAEVGGQRPNNTINKTELLRQLVEENLEIKNTIIERCAQVARNELEECQRCGDCEDDITIGQTGAASRILAGIEALKDKP